MRLFIAMDPPIGLREELASWARAQRANSHVRIVPPENVHLTLVFLGEQPADQVEPIVGAMNEVAGGPIHLSLGEPLLLPPRNPRTFTLAVLDPAGELGRLQGALAAALGRSEKRAFRPHLTLARLGREARIKLELDPPPTAEFTVHEMTLYRSYLEPGGARYEGLATTNLWD